MPKYKVIINRFDGGLNTKTTPLHGLPNESPDLQNVDFDDLGAIKTRNGFTKFNTAAIGTYPIDTLHSFVQNNGTKQLMAVCKDSLWKASGTTFVTVPSAQSVFTNGVNVHSATYMNRMWLSNGNANPYKWNGTEFTRWGVSAPSAATIALTSAGTLTGAYKYVILGINSYSAKGNYGSASTEITAASQQIYITEIPTYPASAGVNNIAICRNTAGASGVYYIVTQITNGVTTYVDNNPDGSLLTFAPTNNGLPKKFTVFLPHLGYMFGASGTDTNPDRLHYSKIDEPEIFDTDDYMRVGGGDGYKITGLAVLANSVIIAKSDEKGTGSVYLLYMPDTTSSNWSLTRLDTANSGEAERVMVNFGNYIARLNKYGVFDLNEQAIGSVRSDPLSFNIETDIYALAEDYLKNAVAITWKNKVWLSVPYGSSQTTNNRVYQYDFVRGRSTEQREVGAWSRFTNMAFNDFAIHDGDLYGGSSASDGFIYKLDTGTNDDGSAINSYYKTMAITGLPEHRSNIKVWRHLYILVEASGDWDMTLTYINDFFDESGNTVLIDLDPGGAAWGTAIWGVSTWGKTIERKRVRIDFLGSVSKAIQLKFSTNTADQYFKVHELMIEYNLRGLKRS